MLRQIETHPNYAVSDTGYVLNIKTGRKLKTKLDNGYFRTTLTNKNKRKTFYIHRLVAQSFISNPKKNPCVNHIDGNKENNHVLNLEWCTKEENEEHAYITGLKKIKPVQGTCLKTGIIINFSSISETGRNGFQVPNVSACCNGRIKSHKGYIWEFIGE
jgi:hypothetical protein